MSQKVLDLFVRFLSNALDDPVSEETVMCAHVCCVKEEKKKEEWERERENERMNWEGDWFKIDQKSHLYALVKTQQILVLGSAVFLLEHKGDSFDQF